MNSRPEIVFTLPACLGGVASFNYNIINYSKLLSQFDSKVILLRPKEDNRPLFTESFNVDKTTFFDYSFKENPYFIQKRLNKLLGEKSGAIVTDNALTINAATRFNNPKTIFNLLHDYFYVNQNVGLGDLADVCIAHSSFFSDAVYAANPKDFAGRSFYIPYGVVQLPNFPTKKESKLQLVFLGRIDEGKGVANLSKIDDLLIENGIEVDWTIIGKGPLKANLVKQWDTKKNIRFFEPETTKDVYAILKQQDIFVFPTTFEGTPVSILECMANGVVTITNDLPGGIRDIATDNIGFRCELNNWGQFVLHIKQLHESRELLIQMQKNNFALAHEKYDIEQNADNYTRLFLNFTRLKRKNKGNYVATDKLDRKVFPNFFVKSVKRIFA